MRKIFSIILLALITHGVQSQEVLSGLGFNPQLKGYKKLNNKIPKTYQPVKLPFVDDFSNNTVILNQSLWSLSKVFANKSYGVTPPSMGVATFDANDNDGVVYSHASSFGFVADSLVSADIRLDSLFGSSPTVLDVDDSVYMSFFFQPQGLGNAPETDDSLVLEFYNPTTNQWVHVWSHHGMTLDSFVANYGATFKLVMIPLTNPDYFENNFKFRFYNYASIPDNSIPSWGSGLYDQWNIDYVYLNANRSYNEDHFNDIVIISQHQSLLKNFTSMPWNQYLQNAVAETDYFKFIEYKNLSSVTKNTNEYFRVLDLTTDSLFKSTAFPSANNILPSQDVLYQPGYSNFTFPSSTNKYADFEVVYRVSSNTPPADLLRSNDSLRFYQKFYNYFSYDDGIPEAGYGLASIGGRVAYQFELSTPDSLQSVQMYFNQTMGAASQQYFVLTIWDDNNGKPGNILVEKTGLRPEYDDELFEFHTYQLDQAIYLSGTFYIGWRQLTNDNLNIGFDMNNDKHSKIYFNTSGSWVNSSYDGALMIRPIVGDEKNAHVSVATAEPASPELVIFPNPNDGRFINISLSGGREISDYQYSIFDISGKLLTEGRASQNIELSNLSPGVYVVKFTDDKSSITIIKKIVVK